MKRRKISGAELARRLSERGCSLSRAAICHWLREASAPGLLTIGEIADILFIPEWYLLYGGDAQTLPDGAIASTNAKVLFKENLNRLLGSKRGMGAALARDVGVDPSMVAAWRSGRNAPEVERLTAIAAFLKTSVADFFLE